MEEGIPPWISLEDKIKDRMKNSCPKEAGIMPVCKMNGIDQITKANTEKQRTTPHEQKGEREREEKQQTHVKL